MRQIVITLSEIYLSRLNAVVEEFQQEGLTITQLYEFGVIIGVAEEGTIARIRNHKGVTSLVEEKQVDIPPPDAEVQ